MKTNKKEENLISGWKLYARQSLPTAQNRTEQNIYREVDPYNNSQRDDRCLSIGLISDPGPQRRGSAVLKMIVENRKVICINTRAVVYVCVSIHSRERTDQVMMMIKKRPLAAS